jgi:hypothetical protein
MHFVALLIVTSPRCVGTMVNTNTKPGPSSFVATRLPVLVGATVIVALLSNCLPRQFTATEFDASVLQNMSPLLELDSAIVALSDSVAFEECIEPTQDVSRRFGETDSSFVVQYTLPMSIETTQADPTIRRRTIGSLTY